MVCVELECGVLATEFKIFGVGEGGTEGVHGGGGTEGVPVSSSATMLSYTTNVSYEQTLLYLATNGDV